jgi:H/ACA ribonucleoprotein complex subunit 4
VEKDDDSEEDKVKPAKKPRTNKVKKEETVKVQSIKDEPTDDVDVDIKPAKKPRSKKAVKKEEDRDIKDEKPAANGIVEEEFKEEIKSGKSDRSQKVVKKEEAGSEADVKAVPVKKTRKNKVKKEEPVSEDEKVEGAKLPEEEIAVDEEDEEEKPKAKKGKKSKKL